MTPNEITTLIATDLKQELNVPFKKQLYERVKYWRSTIIKQSIDKVRTDQRYFVQTIYLPMEKFNQLEEADGLECFASRTAVEIPTPIRINDLGTFSYLGGIDGISPFGYADEGTLQYLKAGKYSKLFTYHKVINRRAYVTENPDLPKIRITGVFTSPEDARKYESSKDVDNDFDWWNMDIPMSGDVEQRVVQAILAEYRGEAKSTNHQIEVNAEDQRS